MTMNHRAAARRRYEDRLVETVRCLDCGSLRGERCRSNGREVITCCQAREDFGRPILQAQREFEHLLENGWTW